MTRTLLIVDIQRDYFPGGAQPLVEPDRAALAAATVLHSCRSAGDRVVHVRHVWDAPEATFMRPGTDGVEFHALLTPVDGEPVITKAAPNAFLDTGLEPLLRSGPTDELVVLGMMSSMCVDATVRAAADLGFPVTVVHDACAAPDLEFTGTLIPGETVHAAFMAALADGYATVVSSAEFLGA